ncbi:MAG: LysE/ArgO family amino acid transporter [Shimia sp.]
MIAAALTGFTTGAALILAIGAQNALVFRQGLLREHVFPLVMLCILSDAILISAGVAGFGAVTALVPWLPTVMLWGGAAFLVAYGAMRFQAAWAGDYAVAVEGGGASLGKVLAVGAAFTWLNPHVYLDTLALMGAISTQFEGVGAKVAFALGGTASSAVFFPALGYGARALAPYFQSAQAWRVLDVVIGITMWSIAAKLLLTA